MGSVSTYYQKISPGLVQELLKKDRILHFDKPTPLIYEGHIPIVAYLLIKGSLVIKKRKKQIEILEPFVIVGISELIRKKPLKYLVEAQKGSTIGYIDKTLVQSFLDQNFMERNKIEI